MNKCEMFFAALFHDVGKPSTTKFNEKKGDIQAIGHEQEGVPIANKSLQDFVPHRMINPILTLISNHMLTEQMNDKTIVKKADELYKGKICWNDVINFRICDGLGRICSKTREEWIELNEAFRQRIQSLNVLFEPLPSLITGKELINIGFKSGPDIGKIIGEIRLKQLSFNIKTNAEAIEFAQKRLKNMNYAENTNEGRFKYISRTLKDIFRLSPALIEETLQKVSELNITNQVEQAKFACKYVFDIKMMRKDLI